MRNRPHPTERRGPAPRSSRSTGDDDLEQASLAPHDEDHDDDFDDTEEDYDDDDPPSDEDEHEDEERDEERRSGGRRTSGRGDEPQGRRHQRTNLRGQRVAVFVDVQNMYHSAKKIYGRNLSYAKLLDATVRGRTLTRALAYVIDRQGVDQQAFVDHLRHLGFHVRRKELIERPDGSRKGSWDLGLALDALRVAPRVDVVVLVTGDGDFVPLAQALAAEGVAVEVACFRESASDSLVQIADDLHLLGRDNLY